MRYKILIFICAGVPSILCKQDICISTKYYTGSDEIDIENVFLVAYQSRTQMWMSTKSVLSLWLIMQCVSACVCAQRADVRSRPTAWRLAVRRLRHARLNTSSDVRSRPRVRSAASPPPHHAIAIDYTRCGIETCHARRERGTDSEYQLGS